MGQVLQHSGRPDLELKNPITWESGYQENYLFAQPYWPEPLTDWIPGGATVEWTISGTLEDCYDRRATGGGSNYPTLNIGADIVSYRDPQWFEVSDEDSFTITEETVDPQFAVEKALSAGEDRQVVLESGDDEVAWSYDVTVSNIGEVDGTSAPVFDTPEVPAGFEVKSVTVDGAPVVGNEGVFPVAAGGVELAVGGACQVVCVWG